MSYTKLLRDNERTYNHIDSDTVEMCILGNFLGSDVRCDGSGFREWFYDNAWNESNSNITSFWKEGNYIFLTDMYSEEENPTELRMTRDQFIKLLDEWLDVVCVNKPTEVIITEVNGEFILKSK